MRIAPITASRFISDGGAMFGLVPKPIWSTLIIPNDENGIPQNATSLLIELDDGRKGLVETGCGSSTLFTEKEQVLHGLDKVWPLKERLQKLMISFESIDFVILTHLHWDHVGGTQSPGHQLNFPNADHYVHTLEWEDATSGNTLLYKSYPPSILSPFKHIDQNKFHLITDTHPEILPGIKLIRTGGHTRGHSMVLFDGAPIIVNHPDADKLGSPQQAIFAGDVCPTQHHLRLVFQTAYDTYPLDTRSWKQEWLPRIAQENVLLFFLMIQRSMEALLI
ncbi:MAG: MBL fold metallo-hydrolase [Kiritimatiellae bacterium]|nr:MBL fold metallo-hydrolase [Kiritimatiellia bacterium]